jgi:hypothetical protein
MGHIWTGEHGTGVPPSTVDVQHSDNNNGWSIDYTGGSARDRYVMGEAPLLRRVLERVILGLDRRHHFSA